MITRQWAIFSWKKRGKAWMAWSYAIDCWQYSAGTGVVKGAFG